MNETKTCASCKWWNIKNQPPDKGACYLNPPTPIAMPIVSPIAAKVMVQPIGIRSTTDANDYCHGYRSALEVK